MVKKIKVDQNTCIGCGACVASCPNTFAFNDDMKAYVITDSKECGGNDDCQSCIDMCPTESITEEDE